MVEFISKNQNINIEELVGGTYIVLSTPKFAYYKANPNLIPNYLSGLLIIEAGELPKREEWGENEDYITSSCTKPFKDFRD